MSEQPQPQWERGYRSHGYWIGIVRVGWVSLPPPCGGGARTGGYGWQVYVPGKPLIEGRLPTLRAAKRMVEVGYRRLIGLN